MGKYLELFRGEVGDLTEKTKPENKPYVAYSTKLGKVTYTVVPVKDPIVEGPADNEIWYTTFDNLSRSIIVVKDLQEEVFYNVISQQYVNGVWKCIFNESLTSFQGYYGNPIFDNLIYPDDLEYNGMIYLPGSISYFDTLSVFQNYNIYYNGTKEQWKSVTIKNVAEISLTIHCTDGDIVIPAA